MTIWSPLSDFEKTTIKYLHDAKQGDAEALLRFYLLASGDSRSESEYLAISRSLAQWFKKNREELESETDPWRRAYLLHYLMHRDFFVGGNIGDNAGQGYDFEQSQLSEIFRSKKFNCVSASLLFTILAHKSGFKTHGVLLPSHAFIELTLDDEKKVEIETTSASGFDWVHDEAFYSQQGSEDWFEARGLEASTYEDYESRRIISSFELGLQNMNNQHVSPLRMGYADRMRLIELFSALSPDNMNAHRVRINFYLREYTRLKAQNNYTQLDKMYQVISPFLERLTAHPDLDLELKNSLAWVTSHRAITAFHNQREEDAVSFAKQELSLLDDQIEDYASVKNNFYFVLARYLEAKIAVGQFKLARQVFNGMEQACVDERQCVNSLRNLYSRWASYSWKNADWPSAIQRYAEYLEIESIGQGADLFKENMQGAYLNWTLEYIKDADWLGAREVLRQCLAQLPSANDCQSRLNDISGRHRLN